jgi:thiosulfate reductase cytochrome b subunit
MSGMTRTETVKRHSTWVRVTHWINAACLLVLLMSGLQIFNAHPALYWGQASTFATPWLAIGATGRTSDAPKGFLEVSGNRINTTGVLGVSNQNGQPVTRGFPAWATIPRFQDLATGRRWHFLMAWTFATSLTVYLVSGLVRGHLRRDLLPTRAELAPRNVWHDIAQHARLRFPEGDAARRYNVLQKGAYLTMVVAVLPLAIATGCTMSPAIDALAPWLVDLFGGRQSARSIHFITANLIVLFVIVHLAMVLLSGPLNNIRSMITGRYVLRFKEPADGR